MKLNIFMIRETNEQNCDSRNVFKFDISAISFIFCEMYSLAPNGSFLPDLVLIELSSNLFHTKIVKEGSITYHHKTSENILRNSSRGIRYDLRWRCESSSSELFSLLNLPIDEMNDLASWTIRCLINISNSTERDMQLNLR